MIDNLRRMALFATVVDCNGFAEAARRLGLNRSALSRQLSALEAGLGVRLLNRTTRRLRLTEAGQRYYESCCRVVAEADRAERAVRTLHHQPLGTLRLTGPVIGDQILVPAIDRFIARYPEMRVDLLLDDRYVDLLAEGLDLAIRIGHPKDSSLVARRLIDVPQVVCGAPAYFRKHGSPRVPAELREHCWIIYSLLPTPERFVFVGPSGRRQTVRVSGQLRVNGGPAIREALLRGMGLSLIPRFYVDQDLRRRRLRAVLGEYQVKPSALFAVYPHREHLSSKVRLFIDLLARELAPQP